MAPAGASAVPVRIGVPAAIVAAPAQPGLQEAAPATGTPPRRHHHAKGDPLEGFNRAMFKVHNLFDRLFFRPVAKAYEKIVPKVVRTGFRHFFANLHEPVVFVNDVLQLRPKRALQTLARFSINSTLGVGGVLDVAKGEGVGLVHHDNGFGTTLGRYGIGPGPYLFLPLFGPSDFRDFVGAQADTFGLRYAVGSPYDRAEYIFPETILTGLDLRVESDAELNALVNGAVDPYASLRSAYLQDRAGAVAEARGHAAAGPSALDDPLTDPAAGEAAPATTSPMTPAPEATPPAGSPPAIDPVTTPPPPVALPGI